MTVRGKMSSYNFNSWGFFVIAFCHIFVIFFHCFLLKKMNDLRKRIRFICAQRSKERVRNSFLTAVKMAVEVNTVYVFSRFF